MTWYDTVKILNNVWKFEYINNTFKECKMTIKLEKIILYAYRKESF